MTFVRLRNGVSIVIIVCLGLLMLAQCEQVQAPPQLSAPPMTATVPDYGSSVEPEPHPEMQHAKIPYVPSHPRWAPSPEPKGAQPN
jgi:hypothetical protein